MEKIFNPESLLVVGVSNRADNLARNILRNLQNFGYRGEVYALGREATVVEGVAVGTSYDELPQAIDLAVILTPAVHAVEALDACGRKGITRAVVESGGFSEHSAAGAGLERDLIKTAEQHGIRVVGPNCISVVNLETGLCLPFALLSPESLRAGPVAVIAQSGGISITYLERLGRAGIGVSKAVSIGNKADFDETDYLEYLLEDPKTSVVVLYLESIGEGRRLYDLACRSTKPIVIQKANRSQASETIAYSHTAALADNDRIVQGVFEQAGVIRSESFRDTIAILKGLSLPPVHGPELVILSRSGGHAVVAADCALQNGFELASLPEAFVQEVERHFRADVIHLSNPLDLGAIFDFDLYADIIERCLEQVRTDAIVLLNTYSYNENEMASRLVARVADIVHHRKVPIAMCAFTQGDGVERIDQESSMSIFHEIEDCMCGLAAARDWTEIQRNRTALAPMETRPSSAAILDGYEMAGPLRTDLALELCVQLGIRTPGGLLAENVGQAREAFAQLDPPVAVKILSPRIIHKARAGGVRLGLSSLEHLEAAAHALLENAPQNPPGGAEKALLIQEMVFGGLELITGVHRDPSFGPVIMLGLGGSFVELMGSVEYRLVPIQREDAERLIDKVLGEWSIPQARRQDLCGVLLSLSDFIHTHASVVEFEINPLVVTDEAVIALDARALGRAV
jgi:acetyltransferase